MHRPAGQMSPYQIFKKKRNRIYRSWIVMAKNSRFGSFLAIFINFLDMLLRNAKVYFEPDLGLMNTRRGLRFGLGNGFTTKLE